MLSSDSSDKNTDTFKKLCVRNLGFTPNSTVRLPQAGGDRIYYRLSDSVGNSAIGVFGPDLRENLSFQNFTDVFSKEGIPVPRLLTPLSQSHHYIIEDLGDIPLFSLLFRNDGFETAGECMRLLAKMQTVDKMKWHQFQLSGDFSRRQAIWDLNYFKYEFLKPSRVAFDEERLEDDFERLADELTRVPDILCGFMYRDFQSRNVMLKDGTPRFIDYQGGRFGPCVYDAVSFVTQAKARIPENRRRELLEAYADEFAHIRGCDKNDILRFADIFILFRTLQVLGAYGFRGLVQRRSHFIESIPAALSNLKAIIDKGSADGYPELKNAAHRLVESESFKTSDTAEGSLTVQVFSFSYKKGYPDDFSGNGGGFMFDCRAMHNPGRYEEYKNLTGLDRPVAEFLENRGEIQPFLDSAWKLTDNAVAKYVSRGFTRLQIGFGCTGGQHRSVYCAQATARHIAESFPAVTVNLIHREQGINQHFN